jgi:hypothetical protein
MRAFAGRDPATGAYFGEPLSQLEEFLVNQVDPFLWLLSAPVCICVALRLECARSRCAVLRDRGATEALV